MSKENLDNLINYDGDKTDISTNTDLENHNAAMEIFADQLACLLWSQWQYMKDKEMEKNKDKTNLSGLS